MIVLDTNVFSELMRSAPSPAVVEWLRKVPIGDLTTTAVNEAELRFGLLRMPTGARRDRLHVALEQLLADIGPKVLAFDRAAAHLFAQILSSRLGAGRPMQLADAQIAAICRREQATLVTRDVRDFQDCGIGVINPWSDDRS